jgi:hypothetical protein
VCARARVRVDIREEEKGKQPAAGRAERSLERLGVAGLSCSLDPPDRPPHHHTSLLPACRNRIRIDSSLTAVSKFLLVTLHPLAEPAGLGFGAYSSGRRFRSCRLPACLSTPLVRILVKSSLHSLGLG